MVYGHYDVQPVDPLAEWTSPPFEPAVVGSRVLARGASDDKSNITIFLQAVEALLATRGGLPVNLRFVFEGEEESSSVHLEPWLSANRERLTGDFAVVSDVGFFEGNLPALTIGLRGLMYAQIEVTGPFQDVHSGVYGGADREPGERAGHDHRGAHGPGRADPDPGLLRRRRPAQLRPISRPTRRCRSTRSASGPRSACPSSWARPATAPSSARPAGRPSTSTGLWGGYLGSGTKTIIPGRATAKISCRLVPDQRPERIFEQLRAFVEEIAPPGVRVVVSDLGGGLPIRTSIDHPAVRAAARALEATFGRAPLYIREGGSIPFVATFEGVLGLPVVLMGFMPPDGNFHAPNEWMDLTNFEAGIRTVVRYFDELAAAGP